MKRSTLLFMAWLTAASLAAAELSAPSAAPAQPAAGDLRDQTSPEYQAIAEAVKRYEAAYNAGDAPQVAGFFAQDVDYIDQDGQETKGRDQIQQRLTDAFAAHPGAKLALAVESVRQIAPDVLIETGRSTVTPVEGTADSTHYVALHVRKGDRWEITQLTETPAPAPPAYEALQSLDWLVGSWQDKDEDQTVQTTISWSGNKNFLTCNFKVSGADGTDAQGWQVIGWDAGLRQIRSWTFDSNGGFGQAEWVPQGDHWLIQALNVLPDGSRATVEHVLTKVNDDKFTWQSQNRTLNGEPQPSLDPVEVSRAPKTP